jgi:hypothetical protein
MTDLRNEIYLFHPLVRKQFDNLAKLGKRDSKKARNGPDNPTKLNCAIEEHRAMERMNGTFF